jgi:hypothetical protein
VFEKLVLIMVVYFVLSIINSMAQLYHKKVNSVEDTSDKEAALSKPAPPPPMKKSKKKKVYQE